MEDHPLVRASLKCALCGVTKQEGLVCCWPCYRLHGLRDGNREVERLLDEAEEELRR